MSTDARTDTLQREWDAQQETFMPDREARFALLGELVEAVVGSRPRVLDLACGTGSITGRLLDRLPGASVVGVDVDPVVLSIAEAGFGDDPRVTIVPADLAREDWTAALPGGRFDAVVSATALHWLDEAVLYRLYADLAGLLRPGGVFGNVDHVHTEAGPITGRVLDLRARRRTEPGAVTWEGWWERIAADPAFADRYAARQARFGTGGHTESEVSADWHCAALRAAGFAHTEVIWRAYDDAAVAALR